MNIKINTINSSLLFSIILINILIGLSKNNFFLTPLNYIINFIAIIYILINLNFKFSMLLFYSIQIFLVTLSLLLNIDSIDRGNLNSLISTFIGYLMLLLTPNKIDEDFLYKYVSYLIYVILFSNLVLLIYGNEPGIIAPSFQGFENNPNAASMTFLCSMMLSSVFIRRELIKPIIIGLFFFLILTTGSRAGLLTSLIFLFLINKDKLKNIKIKYILILIFFFLILLTNTNIFNKLIINFSTNGLSLGEIGKNDRLQFWYLAIESFLSSPESIMFGTGPATTVSIIKAGVHNSYLYQLASFGILYTINNLLFIIYKIKSINYSMKISKFSYYAIPILIYGLVEDGIFDGFYKLWYVFIFLAIFFQARFLYSTGKELRR